RNHNQTRFRHQLRVYPSTFDAILARVRHHPIYHNNSNNEQIPVEVQLAIFLTRLGHYGNRASVADIADWSGVSVGGVELCTKRCMIAIISLHDDVIKAPTPAEKEAAKCWVERQVCPAWRNGYLSIDGTTFNLFQKPSHYGETFYDRKSNYSINAQ
ncbi:hypothetical protein SERLA73DRAFT_25729, partial [Serpula lacrymans var. lacrymans S7.3]